METKKSYQYFYSIANIIKVITIISLVVLFIIFLVGIAEGEFKLLLTCLIISASLVVSSLIVYYLFKGIGTRLEEKDLYENKLLEVLIEKIKLS